MMPYARAGQSVLVAAAAAFRRFLAFRAPAEAARPWQRPTGHAPHCLRRAMKDGKSLIICPSTEGRSLSGLTGGEAEELLDWIEGNGFLLREVSHHGQAGYVVRWEVG